MKFLRLLSSLLLLLLAVPSSWAWGSKGHRIVSRLATQSLPADMPAFLRSPAAIDEIEYLGPEPDRWRSRAEPELSAEQAPDHFIDLEYADLIGTLPRERYQYIAALYAYAAAHPDRAADVRPEKVGFQPYITEEVWERLKSGLRDYRQLSAENQDTKPVEAAIIFYAGWLSHYVADGSQPLHVTIQYNGWVGPNPNGYTTEHTIHSQFESAFVDAAINASDVQPLLVRPHPIGDEWTDYLAYLRHSNALVERVYQLDKAHAFDGTGTPESRQFTAERLAAAASMLRDLYVAAWIKSAEPVPDWHDQHPSMGVPPIAPQTPAPRIALFVPAKGVYHPGGGVSNPVLLYAPKPEGPSVPSSQIAVVGLIVDQNGNPTDVHIVRSIGPDLDTAVLDAVKKYRFKPSQFQGKPVAVQINFEVKYEH